MATLTALKFGTPEGATKTLSTLQELQKQELIKIVDAAIVTWAEGKKKPHTEQLANLRGVGAMSGAFWGMLFGLLFFVPFLGMAIGAAMGALSGHFADYGIDDKFIKKVRAEVTPGTSALFLLSQAEVADRVVAALKGGEKLEVVATNLSREQEDKLVAAFSED